MSDLYVDLLQDLLKRGVLSPNMRVLAVCGGPRDREVLLNCGFRSVTISNVDTRVTGKEYAPFEWSSQDAERIGFEDESFDFCVVADGLHHCQSPHKALLEMYRVARVGVVVLEPRDNLITRIGLRLGFGQDYETAAVHANAGNFGGVRNTEVPNFVYRFTEREIEKTVNCYAPWGKHRFLYWYKFRVPWLLYRMRRNKTRLLMAMLTFPVLWVFTLIFRRQRNFFGFAVIKPRIPDDLHPWITPVGKEMAVNRLWLEGRYGALEKQPAQNL